MLRERGALRRAARHCVRRSTCSGHSSSTSPLKFLKSSKTGPITSDRLQEGLTRGHMSCSLGKQIEEVLAAASVASVARLDARPKCPERS